MSREDLLEIVEHVISELKSANRSMPIIVEGERDEKSLRRLGFQGEILKLNIGLSIINFCERLTDHPEIIILTDFDRKGMELRQKLNNALKANGIKPNDNFWLGLKHLCSREIKEIEHLHTFVGNLKK
jgi:5S rRNA maturation endonuclease (ribonuclease M5)